MNTLKVIKAARELILDKSRWTTGVLARDAIGLRVPAYSSDAVCWCGEGAILKFTNYYNNKNYSDWQATVNEVAKDAPSSVAYLNDHHGHEAVIAAFDKTIARLEAQGN